MATLQADAKSRSTSGHRRLEVNDWPACAAATDDRGPSPSPKKRLIHNTLWQSAQPHPQINALHKLDLRFGPRLKPYDKSVAETDWPLRLGRLHRHALYFGP